MNRIAIAAVTLMLASTHNLFAQEENQNDSSSVSIQEQVDNVKGSVDGMNETLLDMKSTVDALKKIKVSGYIQTQFQLTDKEGAKSYSGGDFGASMKNRFAIRRGRLKINYDNDLTQYVLQLNCDEKSVGIKDAYVSITEPWILISI